jgi:hypothetical protein
MTNNKYSKYQSNIYNQHTFIMSVHQNMEYLIKVIEL